MTQTPRSPARVGFSDSKRLGLSQQLIMTPSSQILLSHRQPENGGEEGRRVGDFSEPKIVCESQ
jgi:hypothetical protein